MVFDILFPPHSSFLLIGAPFSGKDIIVQKYIVQCMQQGHPLIFITTDMQPEEVIKNYVSYGVPIDKYIEKKLVKFVDAYTKQITRDIQDTESIKRIESPIAFTEMSAMVSDIQHDFKEKPPRVILSSLSTILLYSTAPEVSKFMQVLIGKIKQISGSILCLLEENMHDPKIVVALEHLVDGKIVTQYAIPDTGSKSEKKFMFKSSGIITTKDWKDAIN